jgi:hypothetical protein
LAVVDLRRPVVVYVIGDLLHGRAVPIEYLIASVAALPHYLAVVDLRISVVVSVVGELGDMIYASTTNEYRHKQHDNRK